MRFKMIWALALLPVVALALPAQARDARLADPDEPGSVIIFPKFVNAPSVSVDGAFLPRTEIEVGVVCPAGATCVEHQSVKLRFHWVCPGVQDVATKFVCNETDFDITVSMNGKVAFSADGTPINSASPAVPQPNCKNGYLIGWVINTSDQPIKFDGLIGDAVLRGPALAAGPSAGLSTAVEGYKAITIQAANAAAATGTPITPGVDPFTGLPTLVFDGADNHYLALTGKVFGDVKFDRLTAGGGPSPVNALSETFLVLLTLDVRSNLPNNPTFVPLQFWNETERLTSGSTEFLCWTQVELSTGIHPDLTQVAQGTRKGEVIGGPARKIPFAGISDQAGPVTLIGLVQTIEGTAANGFQERSYIYNMFDDSIVVTTYFLPFPF